MINKMGKSQKIAIGIFTAFAIFVIVASAVSAQSSGATAGTSTIDGKTSFIFSSGSLASGTGTGDFWYSMTNKDVGYIYGVSAKYGTGAISLAQVNCGGLSYSTDTKMIFEGDVFCVHIKSSNTYGAIKAVDIENDNLGVPSAFEKMKFDWIYNPDGSPTFGGGIPTGKPDFIVESIKLSTPNPKVNEFVTVTLTIKNSGIADYITKDYSEPGFSYDLRRIDLAGDSANAGGWIRSIKSGESQTFSHTIQVLSGATKIKVILDRENRVAEDNEYNNDGAIEVQVEEPTVVLPVITPNVLVVYVRDSLTSVPIEGATVSLLKDLPVEIASEKGKVRHEEVVGRQVTDASGRASLKINKGKFHLEIRASEYSTIDIEGLELGDEIEKGEIVKVFYLKRAEAQLPVIVPTPEQPPIKQIEPQPEPIAGPIQPPPFPEDRETVTAELNIKPGWNLVSIPGKFERTSSTCSKSQSPYGFVYLKEEGRYISINEAERTGISGKLPDYLSKNAFWIYGFESCRISFEISEYQTFNAVDIVPGWNLVPVTVDMKGLSLNDIKDGCTLKSAYRWEEAAQKWQKINFNKAFSSDDLHKGVLVKSENSCVLGGAKIVPPQFPREKPTTFEECVKAGGLIGESDPRVCIIKGESFREEIETKGAIKIMVKLSPDGENMQNAVVTVRTADGRTVDTKDTQGGAAVFDNLEPGVYFASASISGLGTKEEKFKISAGARDYLTIYLQADTVPPITPIGGGGQLADKVVIKAYVDFQDPFSARFYNQIWPQIQENYGGKVTLDLRDFPLMSIHPDAEKAAEAFRCTNGNLAYAQILFNNQQALSVGNLKSYAAKVPEVEQASFVSCLDSGEMKEKVSSYISEGNQNGITGTPTFFIGSKTVVGAQEYNVFKIAIDAALSG